MGPAGTGTECRTGAYHHLRGAFGFDIEALPGGQGTILRVMGEIDVAAAPFLRSVACLVLAERSGPVRLHLGGVTFLDCAGLDVLVGLRASTRLEPAMVASRPVRRLMELAGVSDLFDLG